MASGATRSLTADQRAVLSLLLDQGYSYAEVADQLGISADAVAARARSAVAGLVSEDLPAPEPVWRGRMADYLLKQVPLPAAAQERSEESAVAQTWAGLVAGELALLGFRSVPEIPQAAPRAPVSRVGGAILLAVMALVVLAVLVVIVRSGEGGDANGVVGASGGGDRRATPSAGNAVSYRVLARAALRPAPGAPAALGVSELVASGSQRGLLIAARGLAPSAGLTRSGFTYDLWLSGDTGAVLVGRAPAVQSDGRLGVLGALPANRRPLTTVLVTRETAARPTTPGTIVLRGTLPSG